MWRFRISRVVFTLAQRILCRLKVEGLENVPPDGPYILTVNHLSTADIGIVFVGFPPGAYRYFAGEKWAKHWLWGPLMSWLGVIFVNRGEVDRKALREALAAIEGGTPFALAPEGTRSKVGYMQPAKDGAAYLASQASVPILPVGISNSDILFAGFRRMRRVTVTMRIGRGQDLSAYTCLIMTHIAALVEPRHRGVYGDTPALAALQAGEDPWPYCEAATAKPLAGNHT
ncbi:MAG: hypothetical protein DCC51_14320 [Anaerolineae bacterium]|nr:MAG: hypothetical protein DCC51_14320 [Anaerolineae bacterium]